MQCRSFEKYVWGLTFIFCAGFMSAHDAHAASGVDGINFIQNPVFYLICLTGIFISVKLFGRPHAGF